MMSAAVLQKNPTEREEKLEGKEGASVLQKNPTEKDLEKLNEKQKTNEETNAQRSAVRIESRKKATRTTHNLILLASLFFFVSIIFLILTEIGSITNRPVLRSSYFLRLNVTDILPSTSATDAQLVNSIARSLGIHDFYQVGLWNFCEGYNDQGITHCSKPQNLYWFNPVQIIESELLAGATIALPAEVTTILKLIRIVSKTMFGFFLVSLCLNFAFIFLTPIVLFSRWYSYHFVTFAFISALFTFIGSAIATSMYVTFQKVITSQTELNIQANLGVQMFVFMWLGAAFAIAGWIVHFRLACVSRKLHNDTGKERRARKKEDRAERKAGGRKTGTLRKRLALPLLLEHFESEEA